MKYKRIFLIVLDSLGVGEALDADDHVLATKVVENVPFQRNCKTTMTGAVYTAGTSSAAFQIETSWGAGKSVDF